MQVSAPKIATVATVSARRPQTPPPALGTDDPNNHPGLAPDVIAQRTAQGRVAENTADVLPPGTIERGAPAYFRTYEQLKTAMFELQTKYPDLVEVRDIGDSSEKTAGKPGRDIWALRITNKNSGGTKPTVEHTAGLHAREIANPELLMTFAKQLLDGYGRDPEATALLNTRQIDLIPMVNADGHAVIERAYANQPGGDMMKRRNTSGPNGAGTDLNRNYEWKWGGPGASSHPSSDTYRGPSAASESETKAVQAYTAAQKPSLYMDWHSYSKLNLYPWGDTREKTPHHEGYKALAEKFSTYNHYSPIQSIQLYPTSGTTDDHMYGSYGVPSLAVETGSSFHQSDAEFAQTLRENLPVLYYGTKVADDPFQRVKGPDTVDVLVDTANRTVTAQVSDLTNGKDAIAGAELVLDPATPFGKGIALTALDGKFDKDTEQVTGSFSSLPGLKPVDGALVYVRAQDAKGNWGPNTAQWLSGPPSAQPTRQ